jgi:hypothetical protein
MRSASREGVIAGNEGRSVEVRNTHAVKNQIDNSPSDLMSDALRQKFSDRIHR